MGETHTHRHAHPIYVRFIIYGMCWCVYMLYLSFFSNVVLGNDIRFVEGNILLASFKKEDLLFFLLVYSVQ
jgi:hypothetical protein